MKRKVLRVSDEIRSAVQKHGYYVRKLSDAKNGSLPPVGLAHSFGRYVATANLIERGEPWKAIVPAPNG